MFFTAFARIFIKLAAEKRKQNEKYLKNRIKNRAEIPRLVLGYKTRVKNLKKRLKKSEKHVFFAHNVPRKNIARLNFAFGEPLARSL